MAHEGAVPLRVAIVWLSLALTPLARAQVDMTGPWGVEAGFPVNRVDIATFAQNGTALSGTIFGLGWSGTIDLASREFVLTGPQLPQCPPDILSGTVNAAGTSFTASIGAHVFMQLQCAVVPIAIGGDRCGNGVVDLGEQCDGGVTGNGNCCSRSCQLAPVGATCTGSNVCLVSACDGGGTCVQSAAPNDGRACNDAVFCNGADTCSAGSCSVHAGDPCAGQSQCLAICQEATDVCLSPPGTPCDDGLFCNGADACGDGACNQHAGDPCAGYPACEACAETTDQCLAPPGAPCENDGRDCTLDRCDGAATCQHALAPAGAICRLETGACDPFEVCDGASLDCPEDTVVPPGTPCDTCQTCDAGGACVSAPRPTAACKRPTEAGAAELKLTNATPDTKDKLTWKWKKGEATTLADLGHPVASDDYALCVFDVSTATPGLLMSASAPAGTDWTPKATGFRYRSRTLIPYGLKTVALAANVAGKAKMTVAGKGDLLPLPVSATPLRLPLLVQLQNDIGGCWEARFGTARSNDGVRFKATSD